MSLLTEREIRLLEYEEIRKQLADLTVTSVGREKALNLFPADEPLLIKNMLQETSEACNLLEKEYLKVQVIPEIRFFMKKAEKSGVLNGIEVSRVKDFIQACHSLLKSMQKEQLSELAPGIVNLGSGIDGNYELFKVLKRTVGVEGDILDSASDILADIRIKKNYLNQSIREKLDQYIKNPSYRRYLQESIVTIRNNRYVIPVKQAYRARIQGIYHDQSSSGATVFTEPFPVVELQNKLQQLKHSEEKEMERILTEVSSQINNKAERIWNDLAIYSRIDFIMAKGQLSFVMRGIEPDISKDLRIELRGARHPLLKGEVVPVDFILGGSIRTLVITGPNTGGKTVTLKTVGLLSIMAQSGLHIPVRAGTSIGVIGKIRADIGDEQSLEQSLSTFSGHLKNIINILEEAGDNSLVLLDELGAGTDPSEGAALARSILTEFYDKGSLVVTTTHINDLKVFAQTKEGVKNASLEFDAETLSPTYRLITGIPGSSNAMIVAAKLGLSADIINRAKGFLSREHEEVEEVIDSLNYEQKRLKEDSQKAAVELKQVEDLKNQLENEKEELELKKKEILVKAKTEARNIIKQAKLKADETVAELHRNMALLKEEKKLKKPLSNTETVRKSLRGYMNVIENKGDDEDKDTFIPGGEIKNGDIVWVKSLNQEGKVKHVSSNKKVVQVVVDDLKISTTDKDIQLPKKNITGKKKQEAVRSYTLKKELSHVSPEIILRGLTLAEAAERLEKYLDDAVLTGLDQVLVIHGRGTGKLRKGLQEIIKNHHYVNSYRIGYPEEGGIGVTVIKLK